MKKFLQKLLLMMFVVLLVPACDAPLEELEVKIEDSTGDPDTGSSGGDPDDPEKPDLGG